MRGAAWLCALCGIFFASSVSTCAQDTNPVDRQVQNPITDQPNVNPLTQDQPVRPRATPTPQTGQTTTGQTQTNAPQSTDELDVRADRQTVTGDKDKRVYVNEGNVDVRIGVYRLQADKVTVYEARQTVLAEGNVVFDQQPGQRITGSRAEWNYATKVGYFENSTGFTNQTQDGTIIYFTADRVDKVSADRVIATNAVVTACDETVPKWSFKSKRVTIKLNDRVRARRPSFRVKNVPLIWLPFASISIKPRDRQSGFLTPTFSGSGKKGFRISNAYYQTLGRSADITLRSDIYTARGLGFGADLRTRASSRSYFNAGFFTVKDRIFGDKASATVSDQGGSSFYARGVQYFASGFIAAADVNITSNLTFRQIFSDAIQQAISPEERSQVFINKNRNAYTFNFLARSQVISIPNARIRTRNLPSVMFERRPSIPRFLRNLPAYFSFETSLEGMSRKETVEDLAAFQLEGNQNPLVTPSIVQRLDAFPRLSVPFYFKYGTSVTASAGLRGTFYSNTFDPTTRLVNSRNITRGYSELELDVRPPALARNFRRADGSLRFRHVIEPYFIYRKITGIGDGFQRVIRFDTVDAIADTNEIEYGVTNRFFTRRSTQNVSGAVLETTNPAAAPLAAQPDEKLSVTVRGKYFFDPYFGGALVPGRRNQFYPINTFSGFTYGGVPRRFSPLNFEIRYRPSFDIFADTKFDLDVQHRGLRALTTTFGLSNRQVKGIPVSAYQTFYYTRAISLAPSLRRFSDRRGNEPGTLQGSQWSPTVFLGNREQGLYGGLSLFFDFQNRPDRGSARLVSSTATLGYAFDCCTVTVQNYTFDVGLRRENRFVFSFRLNGIGTFGTEQIGQNFR